MIPKSGPRFSGKIMLQQRMIPHKIMLQQRMIPHKIMLQQA
jgi:hypothetical protein